MLSLARATPPEDDTDEYPPMNFKQFDYLIALAQEGHFGRAAKRCNIAQPTLSTAIRRLEEELGVPIVMRGQQFIGFTA